MKEKEENMHCDMKGYVKKTKDDYVIVINKNLSESERKTIKSYLYQQIALNYI